MNTTYQYQDAKKHTASLNTTTQQDELLDLVNTQDQVIGTLERSKVYATGLTNFRAVSALIINKHGQLWIPRRTAQKRVSPLHLGFSVGGHVSSGESYDQSFERELQEELNLELSQVRYKKIGLLTPHEHGTRAFVMVYLIFTNTAPNYNREDFVGHRWLTPTQILQRAARGDKVQNDLMRAIQYFFAHCLKPKLPQVDHSVKPVILKNSVHSWQKQPKRTEKGICTLAY